MAAEHHIERPEHAAQGLKVSAYDRSASLLIALLLLVSGAVLAIVIVFFSNRIQRVPPAIPVTPVGPSDTASGADEDLSDTTPGVEESEIEETEIESFLETLSQVAAEDVALISDRAADEASGARKGDPRGLGGTGTGLANSGEPRREIRFEPESFDEYAKWFDAAGLEIGVLGSSDNLVYYATKLSTPNPVVRTGNPKEDQRLYFNSLGGPLYALDRRLAEKAGILDKGKLLLQFCSPATQQRLLSLEQEAADGREKTDIAQTVFRVVRAGGSYDFQVESQQYYR